MSSEIIWRCPFSEENRELVGRFVYDVLGYTLQKCGLDIKEIPPTDCKENVWDPMALEIIGTFVLKMAFIERKTLKGKFTARHCSSKLQNKDIPDYLQELFLDFLSESNNKNMMPLKIALATCNEFILYFYTKNILFDLNAVIAAVSFFILNSILPLDQFGHELLVYLFKFKGITCYTKMMVDVVVNIKIPYTSRAGISIFMSYNYREYVCNYLDYFNRVHLRSMTRSDNRLGLIMNDIYSANTPKRTLDLMEINTSVLTLILRNGYGLRDLKSVPENFKRTIVNQMETRGRLSTIVSELSAPFGQSCNNSSK